MNFRRYIFIFLILAHGLTLRAAELTVFAAASLSDALTELAPRFTAATGNTLRFNFGASGTLARQIGEGAPADLIFSADGLRVDQLEKAGLVLPGTRRVLLANTLVVIIPAKDGAPVSRLSDLDGAGMRRIAIGDPATVPAGAYAKAWLERAGEWQALSAKLVPLDNVRAVLAAVGSGNVDAGFVYKTDALISKDVRVEIQMPFSAGPKIGYPAAVLRDSSHPDSARALIAFFETPEAQAVFARYGFLPAP